MIHALVHVAISLVAHLLTICRVEELHQQTHLQLVFVCHSYVIMIMFREEIVKHHF